MTLTKILKIPKSLILLLSVLALSLTNPNTVLANAPFADCDMQSTFSTAWLQNAKDKLATAGYTPSFSSSSAPAVFIHSDANPIFIYIGDNNTKMELDASYGLQYGAKTAGVAGYVYRQGFNADGTTTTATARLGPFTTYPATQQGVKCVSGFKNLTGTTAGLTNTEAKFPCFTGLDFGDGVADCANSTAPAPTGPTEPENITARDQKLIALGLASFTGFLLLKPFAYYRGNK